MIGLNSRVFIFYFIITTPLGIIIIFGFGCYFLYRTDLTPIAYTMIIIAIKSRPTSVNSLIMYKINCSSPMDNEYK